MADEDHLSHTAIFLLPIGARGMQFHIFSLGSSGLSAALPICHLFPLQILRVDLLMGIDKHIRDGVEGFLDMGCSLGACLNILDFPMLLDKALHFLRSDGPFICQVALVAYQQNLRFRRTGVSYFLVPVAGGVYKGLVIGYVEDYQQGMRASIVGAGDSAKALVASSVPDLQLHLVALEWEGFEAEVHTDGGQENLAEFVIGVSYYD